MIIVYAISRLLQEISNNYLFASCDFFAKANLNREKKRN